MHLTDSAGIARQFQYRDENIATLLREWVHEHPDKIFFHWHPVEGEGKSWTYGQFRQAMHAVAGGLQQRGIQFGDKVMVHSDNCPEMLIVSYACSFIGAVNETNNDGSGTGEADDGFLPIASFYADPKVVKPAQCDALTPAGIVFTPGATGLGKAVLHSHGNLLWAANIGPVNTFFASEDMFLTYMPLILHSVSGSVPKKHNLKRNTDVSRVLQ